MQTKQTQNRLNLEAMMLKSYPDNILKQEQIEVFHEIAKEFSKDGKLAYNLLMTMQEEGFYNEDYYLSKLNNLVSNEFIEIFVINDKVASLYLLIKQYIHCVRLDKISMYINELSNAVEMERIPDISKEYIANFMYEPIKDDYVSFTEREKLKEDEKNSVAYATGIEFLDTAFNGGLYLGQLILVSGDYESGKNDKLY